LDFAEGRYVEPCRKAIEAAEQYADGEIDAEELAHFTDDPQFVYAAPEAFIAAVSVPLDPSAVVTAAADAATCEQEENAYRKAFPEEYPSFDKEKWRFATQGRLDSAESAEKQAQCRLLRDVIGNPFRPVQMDLAELSNHDDFIPKLARTMYEQRVFARLPVLADTLEDTGCDNADVVRHCRELSEHVRGCWVIDLLLGKE